MIVVADATVLVAEIIARRVYKHLEPVARRRVPGDADDWQSAALAL